MSQVDVSEGCWNWLGTMNNTGYGTFGSFLAHRWMHLMMSGDDPEVVRHSCGNRSCVKPTHLLSGTQSENMQDKFFDGTGNTQKLTPGDVREIRARFTRRNRKFTNAGELAEEFGITKKYVTLIAEGKRLTYVR